METEKDDGYGKSLAVLELYKYMEKIDQETKDDKFTKETYKYLFWTISTFFITVLNICLIKNDNINLIGIIIYVLIQAILSFKFIKNTNIFKEIKKELGEEEW